ncbi:hypothetical protein N7461_001262 [Penicillium sp. DV-2018c]|nr:hypothetical protein N7461_001262 [Penicillium sp. DV-2018c]
MTTTFRKGMSPLALAKHWARLGLDHDEAGKSQVLQWIRRIHDFVQSSFVNLGVNPEYLLCNAEARSVLKYQMTSAFGELPPQLQSQSVEVVVPALYNPYHLVRCAYPVECGFSLGTAPHPPQRRFRGVSTTTAPGAPSHGNDGIAATPHDMAGNVGGIIQQTVDDLEGKLGEAHEDMEWILDEMQGLRDEMADMRREMEIMRHEMMALRDRVYKLENP